MKIIFFCGSTEPGKDGVGDYTRRFCGELIRKGQEVRILSLCDHHVSSYTTDHQAAEETTIIVNRIPMSTSNNQRSIWVQDILNEFQPDWISLQFVTYSFDIKGLPFWLPSFLKKMEGNHKWHIMFHELWLGIDKESSFRHKCIGKLQQLIINKMIQSTLPNFVSTQNKLYQFFLKSLHINADCLAICGNIPLTGVKNVTTEFTQFVLFGTIHPGAPFKDFIQDLAAKTNEFSKSMKFVFVGKNGEELSNYTKILENHRIRYDVLGVQSEGVISQILIDSDYGIATTPYFQTEKSGVFAAYREHRVNTICVSREWTPTKGYYHIPDIIKYEKNNLDLIPMNVNFLDLNTIANQFINSISTT